MASVKVSTLTIPLKDFPFLVRMDKHKKLAVLERVERQGVEWNPGDLISLIKVLRAEGLKNIDLDALEDGIGKVLEGCPLIIARAIPPVHGKPGHIECSFEDKLAETAWKKDDSYKIDFRNRNEINNVSEGDLLAVVHPPTSSRDGSNVIGEPLIAKRGRCVRAIAGKNTRLSEDQTKVFSTIEGCVKRIKNRIAVDQIKVIRGSVDFKCGNIDFKGDVIVMGDVKETFSVVAEGSITVSGAVDRAALKAGGEIFVEGGIYGKDGVCVEAEGNISFAFAENANLHSGSSIFARKAMVNCRAHADEMIYLRAMGKAVIGGYLSANYGIESNSIGNPKIPTATVIQFGLNESLIKQLRSLKMEFRRADERRQKEIHEEIADISEEYEKQQQARLIARHITYPGVEIRCGKIKYLVRTEIARMIFYTVKGKEEILMRGIGRGVDKEI